MDNGWVKIEPDTEIPFGKYWVWDGSSLFTAYYDEDAYGNKIWAEIPYTHPFYAQIYTGITHYQTTKPPKE